MSPLVTFLAQRYAEDWTAARDRELADGVTESRATRDVSAKRAILAEHGMRVTTWTKSGRVCSVCGPRLSRDDGLCPTLLALASVYSDHRGYSPAWAPGVAE